jgi:integrase
MRSVNSNPSRLVPRTQEHSRRRHIAADEFPKIAAALEAHAATAPAGVAFLWLLLFSGARMGKIAAAKWEWLDGNVLKLPDSKTGARNIALPPVLLELLAKLPRKSETITGIRSPAKLWAKDRRRAVPSYGSLTLAGASRVPACRPDFR